MKAKHIQVIICLVIFLLFANQAWATDWIYYDTSAVGDKLYYDKSRIKKENESIISVWISNGIHYPESRNNICLISNDILYRI